MGIEVDLEAERERARERREIERQELRARSILDNPGQYPSGKPRPSRWGAEKPELRKAIEEKYPHWPAVDVKNLLGWCVRLQTQRRWEVRHVPVEEWEADMASENRKRCEAYLRERLQGDPMLSNKQLRGGFPGELPVSRATFDGWASGIRKELGIDSSEVMRARARGETVEPEPPPGDAGQEEPKGPGATPGGDEEEEDDLGSWHTTKPATKEDNHQEHVDLHRKVAEQMEKSDGFLLPRIAEQLHPSGAMIVSIPGLLRLQAWENEDGWHVEFHGEALRGDEVDLLLALAYRRLIPDVSVPAGVELAE